MTRLKGAERTYLRGLAHGLRPLVQIGKEGLTEAVLHAIDEALDANELIKIRFVAGREEKRTTVVAIDEALGSECVGLIGHVAIVYRQHPDPERRRIMLPGEARRPRPTRS